MLEPAAPEAALETADPRHGIRYLWLRFAGRALAERPELAGLRAKPDLDAWLGAFSKKSRVPELERKVILPGTGYELAIAEAWLVTLRE